MAEKRGNTGKLKYDFNTSGELEVYMPNLQDWFRVTSREFRSFDGKRRITQPYTAQGLGEIHNIEMITEKYFGPVYAVGTNTEVDYEESSIYITTENSCRLVRISGSRNT